MNCVAPGVIETEMSQEVRERAADEVKSRILLRRFGTPQEVAADRRVREVYLGEAKHG